MGLVADVFLVNLIDGDGQVFGTTTLQDANIEVQVQENDVRGGRGNQLLAVLHSDRDINISLTDVEFKYDWLAKQLGQDIVTGAGRAYAMPKWYTVQDGGTTGVDSITLDEAPDDMNPELAIYDENGEPITGFTVNGSDVEFSGTGAVVAGDKVEVRTYAYNTDPTTETIEIDNSVFADGVKAVLETLEIDNNENPTHKVQYQFDNSLPSGNFTISTASAREAQTQEFSLRVVKPSDSNVVGRVLRMPIVA